MNAVLCFRCSQRGYNDLFLMVFNVFYNVLMGGCNIVVFIRIHVGFSPQHTHQTKMCFVCVCVSKNKLQCWAFNLSIPVVHRVCMCMHVIVYICLHGCMHPPLCTSSSMAPSSALSLGPARSLSSHSSSSGFL